MREIGCYYENIDDILNNTNEFKVPTKIRLKKEGKYMKIEEKILKKEVVHHSCLGCINMTYYTEQEGYKTIEKVLIVLCQQSCFLVMVFSLQNCKQLELKIYC